MIHWLPITFVRLVIFLLIGILIGIYFPSLLSHKISMGIPWVLIFLFSVICIVQRLTRQDLAVPAGVVMLLCITSIGNALTITRTASNKSDHISHITYPIEVFYGVVDEFPVLKASSSRYVLDVHAVLSEGKWHAHSGRVVVTMKRNSTPYQYGDALLVNGSFATIEAPANPGEFDYRQFLLNKQVTHQRWATNEAVAFVNTYPKHRVIHYAYKARRWAEGQFEKVISRDDARSLAVAIILGVKDGLPDDLVDAYGATGVMHILAVSGLHVGILYLLISLAGKRMQHTLSGRIAVAIVSLMLLWFYAFVAGFSPSVLRAVIMFSMFSFGKLINRRNNVYNIIAASAFVLLMYDPFLIHNVGFQLSYLAVIGIVYLQPLLYKMYEADTWLGDHCWKLATVSLAAQAATFPLGLLYFNQFPNYFLLTNMVILDLVMLIFMTGLLVLAFSIVPVLQHIVGVIMEGAIHTMNYIVFRIDSLPYSTTGGVYINTSQCLLLILSVAMIILYFQYHIPAYKMVFALSIVAFAALSWHHTLHTFSRPTVVFYKINNGSAVDIIDRGVAYCISDEKLLNENKKLCYHTSGCRLQRRVEHVIHPKRNRDQVPGGELIVWNRKTIYIVNEKDFIIPSGVTVNYLVLSNHVAQSITDFAFTSQAEMIIIDAGNTRNEAEYFMQHYPKEMRHKVRSLWTEGAIEQNI